MEGWNKMYMGGEGYDKQRRMDRWMDRLTEEHCKVYRQITGLVARGGMGVDMTGANKSYHILLTLAR